MEGHELRCGNKIKYKHGGNALQVKLKKLWICVVNSKVEPRRISVIYHAEWSIKKLTKNYPKTLLRIKIL